MLFIGTELQIVINYKNGKKGMLRSWNLMLEIREGLNIRMYDNNDI